MREERKRKREKAERQTQKERQRCISKEADESHRILETE